MWQTRPRRHAADMLTFMTIVGAVGAVLLVLGVAAVLVEQ
jgi:hypothetical protein